MKFISIDITTQRMENKRKMNLISFPGQWGKLMMSRWKLGINMFLKVYD